MSWTAFILGLPFSVAGMVANFAVRHFIAGWALAKAIQS